MLHTKDGRVDAVQPKVMPVTGLYCTCAVQTVTEFIAAGKSGLVDVTQSTYCIRLSWTTQGCIVVNFCAILLNCTSVFSRCGNSEVNNIVTTRKNVA